MRLAMAQMAMKNNMNENYKTTMSFIEKASGCDLLFFPLLQMSPYFPQLSGLAAGGALSRESDARMSGIAYQAKKNNLYISPNVYLEQNGKRYCASLWFDRYGEFGKTAGMVHVWDRPQAYEAEYFAPFERGFVVHKTNFGKVGIVVGSDRHFPESVRSCVNRGAQLILVPAVHTDQDDSEMDEWELRVQAKQNSVFIAVCARAGKEGNLFFTGSSAVYGPDGRVIVKADGREQLVTCAVDLGECEEIRKKNPYLSVRKPELYVMEDEN